MAQNFTMTSGDTKNLSYSIADGNGDAVDVTGATISWQMAPNVSSTTLITKATGGSGITISTSTVTVALAASDTASYAGQYYWEMQITDGSSNVSTNYGTITIEVDLI